MNKAFLKKAKATSGKDTPLGGNIDADEQTTLLGSKKKGTFRLGKLFADENNIQPFEDAKKTQEEFKKYFGENVEFDFMNLNHRIFQGQKMAEYLRNNSSGSGNNNGN